MLSVFISFFALAAIFVAFHERGKWRERARAAEKENEARRKAHEVQNDVVTDPGFRERVRRHFDRP